MGKPEARSMRLQVNQRGSWGNCVRFDANRETFMAVGEAAVTLANAVGGRISFRIIDDADEVVAYLDAPGEEWRTRRPG